MDMRDSTSTGVSEVTRFRGLFGYCVVSIICRIKQECYERSIVAEYFSESILLRLAVFYLRNSNTVLSS